ncbi:hypothetical protein [Catellatospora tritici]|uniref:hypothetical protein n=1 Tax=Catellatospora tritici TaxID=2851566 RepID=UPI001C2D0006|nr:hypothetical protein [Catellatospora tritici]MBV1853921.1 hypothetical protein [Catellatospora tritici]
MTNTWLPLTPGERRVYQGTARDDNGSPQQHTIISTVTTLTKTVDGVRTAVLVEQDIQAGELDEQELAFFAQDRAGNVWGLGEYPEDFEKGKFVGAPDTWIAGVDGARAGVAMPARPDQGLTAYQQGDAPDIDFLDCAQTLQTNQRVCLKTGCDDHVMIVDEWSPLDVDSGHQRKYYAPNVGNIKVTAVGDPEGETLALDSVQMLDANALATVNAQARAMDKHAYEATTVYSGTPPVE